MLGYLNKHLAVAVGLLLLTFAGAANAACCNVPSGHQVRVPNVVFSQPSSGCSSCGGASSGCSSCGQSSSGCSSCGGGCSDSSCGGGSTGCDTCGSGHHHGHGGGAFYGKFNNNININIDNSTSASAEAAADVNTRSNFNANAFANSSAFGLGGAINGSSNYGGGGGSSFSLGFPSGYVPGLAVESAAAAATASVPYQASRTTVKTIVIQAFCLDDKEVPHPASQVTPDRDIADAYEGELYRCIAGARMQYTWAEWGGKISFDHGQTVMCDKGQALYHSAGANGGGVACRPQKPARDCNERSLLRRFGAGVKVVKIVTTETYTAYRTEAVAATATASASAGMSLDGGVGGVAF